MSAEDYKRSFDKLEVVNLSPVLSEGIATEGQRWNESDYEGAWIPGATSGGCCNYIHNNPGEPCMLTTKAVQTNLIVSFKIKPFIATYASNPQYIVEFDTPDSEGDPKKCSVWIGLLQKNRRAKRKEGVDSLAIGFAIYEVGYTHGRFLESFSLINCNYLIIFLDQGAEFNN